MTELQYGLIGLGAAALAGVLAYNKWQEHAHRKVAERMLKAEHNDVLLGGAAQPAAGGRPEVSAGERREPVLAGGDMEAAPAFASAPAARPVEEPAEDVPAPDLPPSLLDPRLDFIVVMELVDAVPALQILHSQREALQRVSKPVVWVGFNEAARRWESIHPEAEHAYRRLRIGLQLADRRGPAADGELAVFVAAMQQLADELLAVADMPTSQPVLDQALELDRFCAEVDLEIGVNLVSRGTPFSGTKLRTLAESAGMVLGEDGLFTRYDEGGGALFSLQNLENAAFSAESMRSLSTHGLTFLLDVPRVARGERVFQQMLEVAGRFGEALQGMLVDDNRQPLGEAQLEHIKREFVAKPQAIMAKYGFPAGSPQALRLFS